MCMKSTKANHLLVRRKKNAGWPLKSNLQCSMPNVSVTMGLANAFCFEKKKMYGIQILYHQAVIYVHKQNKTLFPNEETQRIWNLFYHP